jgi:hypothetical protein
MIEGLAPQFRNLQIDLAGAGLQRAIIAASPSILPSLVAFVASSATKPVRLSSSIAFSVSSTVPRGVARPMAPSLSWRYCFLVNHIDSGSP